MIKGVLFQESLYKEPFWMLVACCLVNQTRWRQAEPIFEQLKAKYPTREQLSDASLADVMHIVQSLGLYKRRARYIVQLAEDYPLIDPQTADDVRKFVGFGQYAADSWAIFVEGRRDIVPDDVELRQWLEKQLG